MNKNIEHSAPCYIVIWEDRHRDVTVHPFSDKKIAISEARKAAKSVCIFPDDYEEEHIDGWLFYAQYSCEGDSVRVVETKINEAI